MKLTNLGDLLYLNTADFRYSIEKESYGRMCYWYVRDASSNIIEKGKVWGITKAKKELEEQYKRYK